MSRSGISSPGEFLVHFAGRSQGVYAQPQRAEGDAAACATLV